MIEKYRYKKEPRNLTVYQEKIQLAKRELGRSVVRVNEKIMEDEVPPVFYGVKETHTIPDVFLDRLEQEPGYVQLTVDKASDRGRAIDTDLINPVTYRVMTGSSSGGPINILKGINDIAIGTDGGGSVLAPAISCQLPSIMGAGLGMQVSQAKTSTDGISFRGSVGVIGKYISHLQETIELMLEEKLPDSLPSTLKIAIPKKGSVIRPDGIDMHTLVKKYLSLLTDIDFDIVEVDLSGVDDRKIALEKMRACFQEADLILTCEGPVDVYGYGETIPMMFGQAGKDITQNHGKYLIRAANMKRATAVSFPIDELASSLVVFAPEGKYQGALAIQLASHLERVIQLPDVWERYFLK